MITRISHAAIVHLTVLLLAAIVAAQEAESGGSPSVLEEYVQQPDPAYRWEIQRRIDGNPSSTFIVRLTSQSWLSPAQVDRTVWEHWLVIVKPAQPASGKAFLLIGGGSNDKGPPEGPDKVTQKIAAATGSVVAELRMVPNQPLVFHGDGVKRTEDDLIAYGWKQYLQSGDPHWLPRLPMVKSAVRAMDCMQELLAGPLGGGLQIDKFVVAGGSKRGWTTWMTGVADPRVSALVPIVIDVLNTERSMRHHAAVYGFWADAIGDYVHHGIMKQWGAPRLDEIYQVVDPYYHRERLTMPKFIVNAAGDQFFCPDSSQFYFAELEGEKLLRYVPNADHSLDGSDAVESIAAFYQMILEGTPRPRFTWTFEQDGSIRVTTVDRPARVLLWQASNPTARDFRLKTIGPAFESRELADQGGGVFVGRVAPPAKGWTASLVELTYEHENSPLQLKLTTAVRVLPDVLPHAGIDPTQTPYEAEVATGG